MVSLRNHGLGSYQDLLLLVFGILSTNNEGNSLHLFYLLKPYRLGWHVEYKFLQVDQPFVNSAIVSLVQQILHLFEIMH